MRPVGADPHDSPAARSIRAAAAFLLLALVAGSPWAFGCTTPLGNLILALGVFALISLWAAHAILTRRFSYTSDAVSLCLLGLILLTALQLVPLPESVARILSPIAVEWYRTFVPDAPELLPGETEADVPRSDRVRLTLAPAATENLLAQFLAVFLVYAAARNFVADRETFRRLAWVAFAAGVALAVLGLAQYLSGARTRIYWRVECGGPVFGPFANKNHFAFQVNLFAGLAGGLFVSVARRPNGWRSPAGLALLGGLGLMAAAVAFSQSRGGLVAALAAAVPVSAAAWSVRGRGGPGGAKAAFVLALGVAVVAGSLTVWFGWRGVTDRVATLWADDADNRTADWLSVMPLVRQFPAVGVGGGALVHAEPMVRTRSNLSYEFNTLDNDYLEALVEGGIPRLVLTLALAIAAIGIAIAAYRRHPERPNAPLRLGCAFGLAAVAFQSAGDFGLHIPSVALAAAVIAAFAGVRKAEPEERGLLRGVPAYIAAGVAILVGLLVVLADWREYRIDELRTAASDVLSSNTPARVDDGIRILEAAARVQPNNPAVWNDLADAHLQAAANEQQAAFAAVVGPVAFTLPPGVPPVRDPNGHIAAALKAARMSRACQPLGRRPHLTLGTFADRFTRSEPPAAHFDRAKRVAGFDANVWYASGRAAADRGDWNAALADWRESLARSPQRLAAIVRRAALRWSPEELRTQLLRDDPAVWFAATPFVFPQADDPRRKAWLQAAANRWASLPEPATLAGFTSWGTALEELGDDTAAVRVWQRAGERFPNETAPRERLAARLEAEEQYEDAVPVLEWLTARHPDRGDYRNRLEAAQHALKLKAEINRP